MARVTIADVAKLAGVGLSTVDRVMNGRRPVRADTAARVLEAAERAGFYGAASIRERVERRPGPLTFDFLLLGRARPFYRLVGEALVAAARARTDLRIKANVHFVDDLTPRATAAQLSALTGRSDGVAIVTSDHPLVSQAIADLAEAGTPAIAMVSDLTAPRRRFWFFHFAPSRRWCASRSRSCS